MLNFEQFLTAAAHRGEVVNTLFEERLYRLTGLLHRVTEALTGAGIAHEVIGGLAVLIHVEEANPEHATLTRDVGLLIRREDLERVREAALRAGFVYRHAAGVDMLVPAGAGTAVNAVHLVFSDEKVRPDYPAPSPPIRPVRKRIHGEDVMVIGVQDLLRMKLTSNRDKDRVHVRSMDAAGLITSEVESSLPQELRARLAHIRATE